MDVFLITIQILIIFESLNWFLQLTLSVLTALRVPSMDSVNPDLKNWPTLSVIVPAANEERSIEAATRSKICTDYPCVEFILVDDRSSDSTGKIMDEIFKNDQRLKVIHIDNLPEGWLGKLNAMNEGLKVSNGQWILFSGLLVRRSVFS